MRLRKRLVFAGLTVLLLAAAIELLAFLAYRVLEGRWFSYDAVAAERREIVASAGAAAGGAEAQVLSLTLHPFVGFVHNPVVNGPAWQRQTGHLINALGFNDSIPSLQEKKPGRVVVGIFGGSVAASFANEGADELVAKLRETPRYRGQEIVVLRLAIGGHKQPQQLMALTWLLTLGGHLDVVVNLDGFNELGMGAENFTIGVYPFYPGKWPTLCRDVPDREAQRRVGRVVELRARRKELAVAASSSWLRWSVTRQLTWRVGDRRLSERLREATTDLESYRSPEAPFAVHGGGTAGFSLASLPKTIAEHWARCSLQMHQLCVANGIRYFHFIQPNQYVAGSKPMGEEERARAIEPRANHRRLVEIGYPALIKASADLARRGVAFTDLRQVFSSTLEPVYIDRFCHVNARGNRIMARRVAEVVGAP